MKLRKPVRLAICLFSGPALDWAAAPLYFTIAGCDLTKIRQDRLAFAPRKLKPKENAYAAINDTLLFKNYSLRLTYLVGTTNRLVIAGEARAVIAAESNTFAVARRIPVAKGIEVPLMIAVQHQRRFRMDAPRQALVLRRSEVFTHRQAIIQKRRRPPASSFSTNRKNPKLHFRFQSSVAGSISIPFRLRTERM